MSRRQKNEPTGKLTLVAPDHPCRLSRGGPDKFGVGTVWECYQCGTRWEFYCNYAGHGWSRVTS